jgi:hydrogenase nickel incorporation protein HypA/HybF
MHEFGLCEAIVDAVEHRAAGRRVEGLRVRIGARHRVVKSAFDQAFSLVASGTVADGAAVDWVVIPARISCRACGQAVDSEDVLALCSGCGSADLDLEGGDELTLESIRLLAAV